MRALPACLSAHHVRASCSHCSQEGVGPPGTGVMENSESPCGCQRQNLSLG